MWEMFQDWIFSCIAWFQAFVGDWGLAIIIITIIFRIIISPITYKQNKSTYVMNKLNPKIKEIQTIYADDQQKQAEEMQRIYREAHYNPLSGCLPVLLQMPIFIALFQVLQSLTTRVESGTVLSFYGILPDLSLTPVEAFQSGGFLFSIPYFLFVALFGASIIVPVLLQPNREKTTMVMMGIMTVFMVYIGCISPAGVLIFWDISSIIGVCVQRITQHIYKKKDEAKEAEEIKPVEVTVVRKEKKPRPKKKR